MRVLGFSKMWDKLQKDRFTTVRYTRKDRDWADGEMVQIVYHPRSKDREVLFLAIIVNKEPKSLLGGMPNSFTDSEAQDDGFQNWPEMERWFAKTYGQWCNPNINKLTLVRVRPGCPKDSK